MYRKTLFILFFLILTACHMTTPVDLPTTITPSLIPKVRPLTTATPIIHPTTTPTSTSLPIATSQYFKAQCPEILPTLPADLELNEDILFLHDLERAYIFNLDTQSTVRTLARGNYGLSDSISPNGKWIVYTIPYYFDNPSHVPSFLVIESVDGKKVIKIPWNKEKWLISGSIFWLDDQQLILNASLGSNFENKYNPSSVVINPFTGKQRDLYDADYPDLYGKPGRVVIHYSFNRKPVVHNPTLSQTLYISYNPDPRFSAVLWDMQASKAITTLQNYPLGESAFWSASEDKFLVWWSKNKPGFNDWFSLDQQGQTEQLTHWEEIYPGNYEIAYSSLSSNGKKLAFEIYHDSEDGISVSENHTDFYTFDLKAKTLTKYCFGDFVDEPRWSLDGRFLIIQILNPEYNNMTAPAFAHILVYLLDFQQNWMVQINNGNDNPIGFVVRP